MNYGAHQYRRSEGGALSPRDTEASAFVFVNRLLSQAVDSGSRMRGLVKNQQLWSLLLRDLGSNNNRLPPILKADLTRVGLFAMKYSVGAMGDRRALDPLIQVNADMIEALRTGADHSKERALERGLCLAG